MSSSKVPTGGLRFLATGVITGLTLWIALMTAIWVYDPTGILRDHNLNPDLCPAGVKFVGHRSAMAAHFRFSEPEILLVGSSRTINGIGKSSLLTDSASAINMSLAGPSADELFSIVEAASERESITQIWIALDYGLFVSPPRPNKMHLQAPHGPTSDWDYFRAGLFSSDLLSELLPNLPNLPRVRSCNAVSRDVDGFSSAFNLSRMEERRRAVSFAEMTDARSTSTRRWGEGLHQADRMARLDAVLTKLAKKKKDVRIFVPPSHPGYFESVRKVRGDDALNSWRNELAQIAGRHHNVQFLDFSDMYSEYARLPNACKTTPAGAACPFYDLTHFTPELGEKLLAKFK